jgi:electron transfer flavoprotein alpha subunit
MSVLIYVELDNGSIKKTSLEAVAYGAKVAEQLGEKATVLALGKAESCRTRKSRKLWRGKSTARSR